MKKTLHYICKETDQDWVFDNYTIDEYGNIENRTRQTPRKWVYNERGYAYIQVRDVQGHKHKLFVARAILSSFCARDYFVGANAGFKDEDITHLSVENLAWYNDVALANKGTRLERIRLTKQRAMA